MRLQRICLIIIKLILTVNLLFPIAAFAHLISITATEPFPATVHVSSTTRATFTVTNITSRITLTVVDQSHFPRGSGLSIASSTCGNPMGPGLACRISVQLEAPSNPQTISAELREWAKPSVDGVRFPFTIGVIGPKQFVVTPSAGSNGTINPSTPQTVNSGSNLTFNATPASGFVVNQWLVDGSLVQTGGTTFSLNNITANHAVRVTFTIAQHTVTPSAGAGGTISPSTPQTVNNGASLLFTATPAASFTVDQWLVDGSLAQTGGTTFTLSNITADHTVNVTFSLVQHIVTPSAGAGGTISPNTPQTVNDGASLVFTATPSAGFAVNQWLLDGGLVQTGGLTFTLNNITADHTVLVTFFSGLIAVGNYRNISAIQTPLIFQSSNNGSTWSPITTTLPIDFISDGSLAASSCVGITCIGAGIYNNGAVNKPLTILSTNAGSSWASVTAPVPVDFASAASVKAATCEGSTCVAVGAYSTGALQKALILVSSNTGTSWSAVAPTLPVNFLNFASLNAVTCIGSTCFTAGSYTRVGNVQLPLLLVSSDSGATFSSVTPTLPPTYSDLGTINSVTCEGSVCIGTGVFFEAGFQARPLVLVSNNLGGSFSFVIPSLPGDFSNSGFFNAVTCTGSICNGAGNYSDGVVTKPLLFHSTDSGSSWSAIPTTLPPNFFDSTLLRSITCTGLNCIAAGDYIDAGFVQFPMLLVSTSQGAAWTSFALTLPIDFLDLGTINALNCSNGICTAVGEYTNTGGIELPLIYVSSDSGVNWSLVAPTLPANFADLGVLNATSGTL